jgi:hypothetical protein
MDCRMGQELTGRSYDVKPKSKRFSHWGLVIILTVFGCLSFYYSLVLPLGEAADEPSHFALVRFIAEHNRPPLSLEEQQPLGRKGDASPIYHGLVALITQHVDVSSLPSLPNADYRPERWIPTDGYRNNVLLHTEDEAYPFRGIVLAWHLARLPSIPLGAMTVIAVYSIALSIFPGRRYFALAAAGYVAFLPRFVTSSAVVNDDNLVLPLVAFSLYFLVRVLKGEEKTRVLAGLGVLMGLAAITKYHALVLVPEMTLVLIVAARQRHWGWRVWFHRWAMVMIAFLIAAGWWFVYWMIHFNQVAQLGWVEGLISPLGDPVFTSGLSRIFEPHSGSAPIDELSWIEWATLLFRSFWIGYGSNNVFASPTTYRILGLVSLVAILGLANLGWTIYSPARRQRATQSNYWWPVLALLAFHFLVYLSIVVARYLISPIPETAHGRHLYPAISSVALFLVLGWSESLKGLYRLLEPLLRRAQIEWSRLVSERSLAIAVSSSMLVLSAITPSLFILPHFPYLPMTSIDTAKNMPTTHPMHISFAEGLDFEGYDLGPELAKTGDVLPITLYWRAGARQARDYLISVCLTDDNGSIVTCHRGHPVNGRYPVRAWEVGFSIRDEVYLAIPYCLAPGNYDLTLSVLPLRLDTPFTAVDSTVKAKEPIALGAISLPAAEHPGSNGFEVWIGDRYYSQGEIKLEQIRQSLTVINYWPREQAKAGDISDVKFVPLDEERTTGPEWYPLAFDNTYRCPGGLIVSVHNFVVDPGLVPGSYRLETALGTRSDLWVTLLTRPRDFNPPDKLPAKLNASFNGEIELLGYEANLAPAWPGDTIEVTTYWRALRTMSRAYAASFHLLDNEMNTWGQIDRFIGSHYPNVLWAPGEFVEEVYAFQIDKQALPGLYNVEFGVYDYEGGIFRFLPIVIAGQSEPVEHISLGYVRVMDPARNEEPSHPLTVELGEQIQLLGYDLSSDHLTQDETLHLTLHWKAIRTPMTDYTVFTQLIGPDGSVWGQKDNQPQGGRYPTTAWALHDAVVDRYELTLRENAPSGEYQLLVGMYNLSTGQRLIAIGEDGKHFADDAVPLATVVVN